MGEGTAGAGWCKGPVATRLGLIRTEAGAGAQGGGRGGQRARWREGLGSTVRPQLGSAGLALTLCSLPSVHGLHRSPPFHALPGLQHSHPAHQVRPGCGGGGVWCVALCWEVRVVDSATIPSPFPAWGAALCRVRAIWGGAQSQLCPRLPVTHALRTPDDLLETTAHPSESVWVPRGVLRTPQHVLAPGGRCCWLLVETQGRAARGWEPVQGDQGMSTVLAFFWCREGVVVS